jgi:CRISPR-associated protein Csb2
MPVSILVRLGGGRYDAGGERPSESEWPPHPARVFCALAASAESDADWSALRWLEQQGPPQVWADPEGRVHRSQTRAWVVENAIRPDGGNLSWPARNNGFRARAFAVPSRESFAIVWPVADPTADTLSRLNLLAWRVPYVGRSTGSAQVSAIGVLPADMAGTVIYEPAVLGQRGQFWDLRVPYVGYTEALRSAYADGRRSWEVARALPYTTARTGYQADDVTEQSPATAEPFGDLLVWGIERPVIRVGGDLVVSLASAMRRAVLSLVGVGVPGQVSGHTQPGRTHLAFLALPDVGHEHADGHVLGLALALPRDMPDRDLTILLRSVLLEHELKEVRFSTGRPLAVSYGSDRSGLRPSRWTARPGEREWVSVTPMMLDGHTRRGRDEASEVVRSLVIAGYPEPTDVEVSATPMVTGGIWRPRHGSLPPGRPRRQMVHARIRFHQPVIGPVLAGSMRYLGLGLFLPANRLPSRQAGLAQAARQAVLTASGNHSRKPPAEVSR